MASAIASLIPVINVRANNHGLVRRRWSCYVCAVKLAWVVNGIVKNNSGLKSKDLQNGTVRDGSKIWLRPAIGNLLGVFAEGDQSNKAGCEIGTVTSFRRISGLKRLQNI